MKNILTPMTSKKFNLIYKPEQKSKYFLFTNINLKGLAVPVTLSREKPLQEEVVFNQKAKSEVVEYEDEVYKKLKEKESNPLLIEDSDHRTYAGKLQDLGANNSCYFAFVGNGTSLKVVPIKRWYRFTQRVQSETIGPEEPEIDIKQHFRIEDEDSEDEREEIDYDESFDDDDDGEEHDFKVVSEKKLSSAGKKLRNIMENYEEAQTSDEDEGKSKSYKSVEDNDNNTSKTSNKEGKKLTKDSIKGLFTGKRMSLKDLLKAIKSIGELGEVEKNLVKEFISERCNYETDKDTGERILILKK